MCMGIYASVVSLYLIAVCFSCLSAALPATSSHFLAEESHLHTFIAPRDESPGTSDIELDRTYLAAQIGGIVGSYAFALILVAIGLLVLGKTRREHLRSGEDLAGAEPPRLERFNPQTPLPQAGPNDTKFPLGPSSSQHPSALSNLAGPIGFSSLIDQAVVARDKKMAEDQLSEMYRRAFEQEEARQKGVELDPPSPLHAPPVQPPSTTAHPRRFEAMGFPIKGKSKPAKLELGKSEKKESRTASLISALISPRKNKKPKGFEISAPILSPATATFPPPQSHEMGNMATRDYVPSADLRHQSATSSDLGLSIDERLRKAPGMPQSPGERDTRLGWRIDTQSRRPSFARDGSAAPLDDDGTSPASDNSSTRLIGLPSSPKPSVSQFPSVPTLTSVPEVPSNNQSPSTPSAVRAGGTLPLRAYESSFAGQGGLSHTTKQTVFTRTGHLTPAGGRTPLTGAPVPYTPYQPFSPVFPITPGLVTKADRIRKKKMEPKTPTMDMVKSQDELW